MRPILRASLLAAVAAALFAAPAQAATKRERICAKRGVTVVSSKTARVFEVDREGNRSLFGCMRSGGRLQLLSTWFSCDCSTGDEPAPAADLHAGRYVEVTEFEACGPIPDPSCGGSSTALRDLGKRRNLSPQGDVTQVVARGTHAAYADGRVVLLVGGEERVVDPGPGLEAGSLALSLTRLYWTRNGAPFSAPL
jgi:hypothetical protein